MHHALRCEHNLPPRELPLASTAISAQLVWRLHAWMVTADDGQLLFSFLAGNPTTSWVVDSCCNGDAPLPNATVCDWDGGDGCEDAKSITFVSG